jgi:allophanate hydrolase
VVEVDLRAYLDAGAMLYGGALVAERTASVGAFLHEAPPDADPTVAEIIMAGRTWSAVDLATDRARLERLRIDADAVWATVDAVLLPVAPCHPTLDEVAADPIGVNGRLGRFVSGCNLVDWCAAAVPMPTDDGLPFGVQLLGPAWSDPAIWSAAATLIGTDAGPSVVDAPERIHLAVCGAHLAGEPLNHQLTDRGAELVETTTTAPHYRMVALAGPTPKPGLHRVAAGGGAIEVEVWSLDPAAFGHFVAEVPAPLAIGQVELADGRSVAGFLCDALVAADAPDITASGGWRAWRSGR